MDLNSLSFCPSVPPLIIIDFRLAQASSGASPSPTKTVVQYVRNFSFQWVRGEITPKLSRATARVGSGVDLC